jgi:TIR domain-containing protein
MSDTQAKSSIQFQHDIFLSHNKADKEWVRNLAVRIEKEQWDGRPLKVFFDEWDIRPGDNIPIMLEQALSASRKIGLVVSPNALSSAWVELERSITLMFDPANRHRRLIPLLLHGADRDIPPLVRPLRYIDFREPKDFGSSFELLLCALRQEPLPRGRTASPPKALEVSQSIKTALLAESNFRCSICHTSFDLGIYQIGSNGTGARATKDDLITLCGSCHVRAWEDETSAELLYGAKKSWIEASHDCVLPSRLNEIMKNLYDQAIALSLSKESLDLKKAIVCCRQILHYDPFHQDATLLLHKLQQIEEQMDILARQRPQLRFHSSAGDNAHHHWNVSTWILWITGVFSSAFLLFIITSAFSMSRWLFGALTLFGIGAITWLLRIKKVRLVLEFIFLYSPQMTHEGGHIRAMYEVRPVVNALGQKMPFKRYFDYIELIVDGSPLVDDAGKPLRWSMKEGIRQILLHGKMPTPAVNRSRMENEWYSKMD